MSAPQQANHRLPGRPPNRGPNPNVAPFVPQSMQHAPQLPQQSGYNPRHQQPYYAMQGTSTTLVAFRTLISHVGGYGAAPPPHMYAPHLNQAHLPYPPMQMGLNPSLGLGVPGLAPPTAPPPVVPPPREKKAMLIIDPRTQKPINECLAEPSDKKANPPKATSTLRAASKEFVMPSAVPVASHISPPIPPSSPIVHKEATPLSPKPHPKVIVHTSPTNSPKHSPKPQPKELQFQHSPKPQPKELQFQHSPKPQPKELQFLQSPTSKPKSPVATPALSSPKSVGSPKAAATPVEPSLVFGTVELDADLLVASPTNVSLPPGFEAPAEDEEDEKQVVAPKRTITRPPNDAPAKKGKTCYSVRFLFSHTLIRYKSKQQWQRDQTTSRRTPGGGRGGKSSHQQPFNDGVEGALKRNDENRWVPVKATSNLEKVLKQVQSIMNKMTTQMFDVLSRQLSEIHMESDEMLTSVITSIFDKALGEPHFCELYANLCVRLETHWQVWSFLQIVHNQDLDSWWWTKMSDVDAEVVGPFATADELFENAEEDPLDVIPAPEGLTLKEVRVRNGKFIKVWEAASSAALYWSGQNVEDLGESQVLYGPFASWDEANINAIKTTSFKRLLLNACQAEFEKDNIYEELDKTMAIAREEGTLTAEVEASYAEKKMLTKRRMLGNIRFIGELFRKGMLQERIMHACIMKLMGVVRVPHPDQYKIAPINPTAAPDDESIESLSKLLTTMGKDLEALSGSPGAMAEYFDYLTYLTKDKRLSSRINFMILDVIDLRHNRWVPRRKELTQKTLLEIRNDAEKEYAAAGKKQGPPPPSRGVASSSSAREMGQRGAPRGGNNPPPQRSNFNLDRSRSQQVDKAGPSGRPATYGSFKGKAGGGGGSRAATPPLPDKPAKVPVQKEIATQVSQLSEDVTQGIAKKAKAILEEFVQLQDAKEAAACVAELKTSLAPGLSPLVVSSVFAKESFQLAIEAKDAIRQGLFDALTTLHVDKVLESDAIKFALEAVVLAAPDVCYDVPKIHEHVGTLVSRFFRSIPSLSLEWLISGIEADADLLEELVESGVLGGIVGVYLSQIPPAVAHDQSKAFVAVNVTSILPSHKRAVADVLAWMTKFNLSQALPAIHAAGQVVSAAEGFKDEDATIAWVEANVHGDKRKDRLFCKQTCLFLLSTSGTEYSRLLMGLCGNIEGELTLVSGIVQEVAPEKLKDLLSHLLDAHVVSDKALTTWKDTSRRSPSREKALVHIGAFIDKLK
ncbi:hypothetical protein DYB34_004057 [Aphanomyces astaci]|uniref:MI domain-containing protein n=4 Tax=Aphanomyces astaci TaxID=112090 RepID=A0A418BUM3_APHAT|nr:hypothetical protein DYB34_004057 [Aphanomyces astaci]